MSNEPFAAFTFAAHDGWPLADVVQDHAVLGYVTVIDGDKTAARRQADK